MQQLGIDKIIAVEGLLNQMQILNDFGFESIAIAENYNDKSIEKEVRNLLHICYKMPPLFDSR